MSKVKIPESLSPEAREEWLRLAPHLESRGLLTELYVGPFSILCEDWALMQSLKRDIEELGSGDVENPTVTLLKQDLKEAEEEHDKLCKDFGLTPGGRPRVEGNELAPFSEEANTDEGPDTNKVQ